MNLKNETYLFEGFAQIVILATIRVH